MDRSEHTGQWYRTLQANGIRPISSLLPDFVVEVPERNRLLLIEVKLTVKESGMTRERIGVRDLFAYLHDVGSSFGDNEIIGLVVAWNASGHPLSPGQRIQVTSQFGVGRVFRNLIGNT